MSKFLNYFLNYNLVHQYIEIVSSYGMYGSHHQGTEMGNPFPFFLLRFVAGSDVCTLGVVKQIKWDFLSPIPFPIHHPQLHGG